jgi:CelD/BcsL family acetyltransferase involved in cellulose biosynthesis
VCEPLGDPAGWHAIDNAFAAADVPFQMRSRVRLGAHADSVETIGVHQSIPLGRSVAQAFARCHPKQRANVRQAEAAGLTHRIAGDEEGVELFYALHSRVRKNKHGLLPQPRRFFARLAEMVFPDRGFVLVAQCNREPVAAMIFLRMGSVTYYKFSASDLDALALRPNHFLLWRAIEMAIDEGAEALDLGIAEDEGLIRFKNRFGADSTPVFAGRYGRLEKSESALALEATLRALTSRLTSPEAPLASAQAGGNVLYRYFV